MHDSGDRRARRCLDGQHRSATALGDEPLLQVRLGRGGHLAKRLLSLPTQFADVTPRTGEARRCVVTDSATAIETRLQPSGHTLERTGGDAIRHLSHDRRRLGMLIDGSAHLTRHLGGGADAFERRGLQTRAATRILHIVRDVVCPTWA